MATASFGVPRSGDQGIDALISGWHWNGLSLTYAFPSIAIHYDYGPERNTIEGVTFNLSQAVTQAFKAVSSFTELGAGKVTGGYARTADIRVATSDVPSTAYAYLPGSGRGGDIWFNKLDYRNPRVGDYAYHIAFHEVGHALGLKHGHETGHFGKLPAARDSLEFSIMTYRNYIGGHAQFASYAQDGAPQTFMMYDIAALQHMYGANFNYRAGDTTYKFDPTTGVMSLDGTAAPDPRGDTIFRTIWDGGGIDTFDLRAYSSDMRVSLVPGQWSLFSKTQLADLGDGHFARANVFNTLLYNADTRSLIENVQAGRGDDKIVGNQAINDLLGAAGDDVLLGMAGDDHMFGGAGGDRLDGATGSDLLNGSTGNDLLIGQSGNDVFIGGAGNDDLRGGTGLDTAVYVKAAAGYAVTTVSGTTTVRDLATNEADKLIGIETLQFSDGLVPI